MTDQTQPRSLNTLYKLLWEEIKDGSDLDFGICAIVTDLRIRSIISRTEEDILKMHMWKYKPISSSLYWFPFGNKGTKQRKDFVQLMIKLTETI